MVSPFLVHENPYPRFVFLDFESSGLDKPSFPIEVGLAWCNGQSQGYLVRPAPLWETWTWSRDAAAVHGIRHEDLVNHGHAVEWVALWLNEQCRGKVVLSDNPVADGYWLNQLFAAAEMTAEFALDDADVLVQAALLSGPDGLAGYEDLKRVVEEDYPLTHKAADDALFWAMFFRVAARNARTR